MNYPRRDTRDKITGYTKYTIDYSKNNCLFAVLFRSKVASAKIKKLDYQKALDYPGVKAIISSKDICLKRPMEGLTGNYFLKFDNKELKRNVFADEPLSFDHI